MNNILSRKAISCLMIATIFMSCNNVKKENETIVNSIDSVTTSSNTNQKEFDFLPSSTSNQIIVHDNYTLSYREEYEQAEWVAYELKKEEIANSNFQRPFFIEDNEVKTGSADWRNYKRSGYDKGHLCPAGDRKFSKKAFDETFLTSNISPQKHNFNDGVWNRLEQKVRYWATKYDKVYVITGGVLEKGLATIGKEDVAVPNYFYKIVVDTNNGNYKMIGFLVPAEDSNAPLYSFVVPVDEIEKRTGIDFFPKLEDKTEAKLESTSDYKNWSFN
jgi:endonuclease G, mitochondrial